MTADETSKPSSDLITFRSERIAALSELAYALTGDAVRAAELTRRTLVRAGLRWRRLRRDPGRDRVVVTMLVRDYLATDRGKVVRDRQSAPADAIARLPTLMRAALALRYVAGLSDDEVAAAVRASRGTVRTRATLALARLAEAGLLPPAGPGDDGRLVRRLLVPPSAVPPADAAELDRIGSELRHRRRRRLVTRAAATTVAAAAVAGTIVLGSGAGPLNRPDPVPAPLTRPRTSGSIPEPVIRPVANLAALAAALPGMSLTKVDLGEFQVRGTTSSGRLLGSVGTGRDVEVVEFDLGADLQTVLAEAELPFVDEAAGDDDTVVWMETEHEPVEGGYRQRNLIVRCLDRTTDAVDTLDIPKANPRGVPYPDTGSTLLGLAVGSSGRIVLAIGGFGDGRPLSESSDLYLARRCGEPFRLLSENARSPQFAGDELYYLRFDGLQEGLWRRRIAQPGPGGAARQVAAPASSFLATADALLWDARKSSGFGGGTPALNVARLDGSGARPVPSVEDLDVTIAARSGLAGQILDRNRFRVTGLWLYLPSWGAIFTLGQPAEPPRRELAFVPAGGNSVLIAEYTETDSTENLWLLNLP